MHLTREILSWRNSKRAMQMRTKKSRWNYRNIVRCQRTETTCVVVQQLQPQSLTGWRRERWRRWKCTILIQTILGREHPLLKATSNPPRMTIVATTVTVRAKKTYRCLTSNQRAAATLASVFSRRQKTRCRRNLYQSRKGYSDHSATRKRAIKLPRKITTVDWHVKITSA